MIAGTRGIRSPVQRAMLTVCAMAATIMQALDTTVANVALPYMQGSLSASIDQVNWVLTSYIVASAIFTAPVGWLANRFGRKRLFLVCVTGFTFASLLCGLAHSIEQMVMFRLLQGIFGAGLIPLSQAVMLDSYPVEQRGTAMSIWGMGVMLGPIMGPTIGGWLTETYSWHWVFLINFPIGILAFAGLTVFMEETQPNDKLRFDWIGFAALTVGIGSLQLMFDRGEQLNWFEFDRDRCGTRPRDRRLLLFLRTFADDRDAVRPLRLVQGPQFRRRLLLHGAAGHDRVLHHGAVDAVPAERARLSGALGRTDDGGARAGHDGRHAGGREAPENFRGAHADAGRHGDDRDHHVRDDVFHQHDGRLDHHHRHGASRGSAWASCSCR